MKIMFICGSMEPGRDGVGDYTRCLAGQLVCMGHEVRVIALNERVMGACAESVEVQHDGATAIEVLRLPASMPWKARVASARGFVDRFDPQWMSLQYVPYAFHIKGLPICLARRLKTIGAHRPWQVMFHELWLCTYHRENFRRVSIGRVQRQIVRLMLRRLSPRVVNTHASIYALRLRELGARVQALPLFSNIPVCGDGCVARDPGKEYTLAVFGTVHPGKPFGPFVDALGRLAARDGYLFRVSFIGRNGAEAENWMRLLDGAGIPYQTHGEVSPEEVSALLAQCDAGLTSNPTFLAEKSGTVRAMTDHGLPVICIAENPRVNERLRAVCNPMQLVAFDGGELDPGVFCDRQGRGVKKDALVHTASLFLKYLTEK